MSKTKIVRLKGSSKSRELFSYLSADYFNLIIFLNKLNIKSAPLEPRMDFMDLARMRGWKVSNTVDFWVDVPSKDADLV